MSEGQAMARAPMESEDWGADIEHLEEKGREYSPDERLRAVAKFKETPEGRNEFSRQCLLYFRKILRNRMGNMERGADGVEGFDDVVVGAVRLAEEHLEAFRGESSFTTWLYRIAMNEAAMYYRKREARHSSQTDSVDALLEDGRDIMSKDAAPDEVAAAQELKERIQSGVKRLPEAQQKVIRMHHLEELSLGEVAERLGISVAAVKSHLFRARKTLKENGGLGPYA